MKHCHEDRCCLILASGQGQRIGGPKALLNWKGMPLAAAHFWARKQQGERALVVTRESIAEVLTRIVPRLEVLISHEADELGPAGSIAAAVRAGALSGAEEVVVTPVDVPPASDVLIESLAKALDYCDAARPQNRGQFGHPVICRARLLLEAYAAQAPPLRDLLATLGARCAAVEVDDPDVLVDFDTREALEARLGRELSFWR